MMEMEVSEEILDVKLEEIVKGLEEGYMEEVEKSGVHTSLAHKNYEPLIIRRYTTPWGVPLFIGIISGDDLSDLDKVVKWYFKNYKLPEDIQGMRNWVGRLSEIIARYYERIEGIAITLYADKMAVSSLMGDFMHHDSCRSEYYFLLNFMTRV